MLFRILREVTWKSSLQKVGVYSFPEQNPGGLMLTKQGGSFLS